jgi:uroporphyrinogen decarboxylase
MGMENTFANMHLNPDMMRLLFDRISEVKARKAAAFAESGVDVLWIGDDVGSQNGPLVSPAMWREFLLPPLKKIIARGRAVRPDVPIAYHSCGSIGFAVEGLIEAGVDVLESVQPEANDPADLKERYGDRLAFWGGAGSQSTMSHGSPDDVRAEVKRLMETVGRGGGFILAPAHRIEPECPLENIDAFLEAVEQYGYYR